MNTLDSLFDWFFTATIRGALLTFAVLALQAAVRGWMPARWRYALWLPVVFVLASPMLPESRWSLENWVAGSGDAPVAVVAEETAFDFAPVADAPPSMAASALPVPTDWRRVAQTGWLAGAAGVAGFVLVAYARTMRRMRRGAVPPGADLTALLAETALACGLRHTPRLLVSTEVRSPAVCGLLRPLLLLPADFPAAFTPREARLVLLHELTHLKRHDLPLNWLFWFLQAIHWCNPVLWFAFACIRADREAACDAQVLAGGAEDRRADYGHALLNEGALAQSRLSLGFVGIFERKAGMPARLRAIAGYRRAHAAWGWLAGLLIAALVFAGATRAQQTQTISDNDLREKFDALVIPKVDLRNATVAEAFDFLQKKSVEFDPAKIGAKINLKPEARPAPGKMADERITLSLTNIPLGEAMKYVTNLAGLKYRWENRAFTVVPLGWQGPLQMKRWKLTPLMRTNLDYHKADDLKEFWIASGVEFPEGASVAASADFSTITMKNTQESLDLLETLLQAADQTFTPSDDPTWTKPLRRKLDTIIIPTLQLRDATLREAVDFLKKKGVEMDSTEPGIEKRGVNIVLKLDTGDSPPLPDARITLSLVNVPLGEALRAVAAAAKVRCRVELYAVALVPLLEETGLLMTKEWRIGRRLGAKFVEKDAAGRIDVKSILSKAGLTFPEGAAATFIPQKYLLVMRNTETNCERLDALVMEDAMPPTPGESAPR